MQTERPPRKPGLRFSARTARGIVKKAPQVILTELLGDAALPEDSGHVRVFREPRDPANISYRQESMRGYIYATVTMLVRVRGLDRGYSPGNLERCISSGGVPGGGVEARRH